MNYTGEELLWIAICDDERKSAREIREILMEGELKPGDFKISMFASGEDLLRASVSRYNLLILDMILPGQNGREIAKEYRKRNKDGLLVFCTGKCSPVPSDFKSQPYRYMRKGQTRELRKNLLEAVEEMYRRTTKHHLMLTYGKTTVPVDVDKILYIEIARNGSIVYYYEMPDVVSELRIRERPKDLYSRLCIFGFEFPHNSYLVNCRYVKRWDSHEIELADGTHLNISRAKEKAFRAACVKYFF